MSYNLKGYIAGGLSGIIEVLGTHPLDFWKTGIQNINQGSYYNYKNNNFIFLRGLDTRLLGIIPCRFVFWGSQDTIRNLIKKNELDSISRSFIIGNFSGFFQTTIDNPVEIKKINKMIGKNIGWKYAFKNNWGFHVTYLRNSLFIFFLNYFGLERENKDQYEKFINCAIGGFIGSVVTQPLDYLKTYYHTNRSNENLIILINELVKDKKYIKFYTGGMYRSLLSFFTMGIGFVSYDKILEIISIYK